MEWWGAFAIEGVLLIWSMRIAKERIRNGNGKMTDLLKDRTSNVECRRARKSDERYRNGNEQRWTRHGQRTVKEALRAYPNLEAEKMMQREPVAD